MVFVVRMYADGTVADQNGMMGSMMQDLAFAIPGVDEAMSFAEIMKYVPYHYSWLTPHANVLQTRQVNGILCDCLRHCANGPHPSFPLIPNRLGESLVKAECAERAYRSYAQPGASMKPELVFLGLN